MKSFIRNLVFYSIALFLLPIILAGVKISGGIGTIIFGGFTLTLLFMFVKPLLSIVTFPLNVITLGFFSFLVNIFLLYLLTVFIPAIDINAFRFSGVEFLGFIIPQIQVNTFFAFFATAFVVYSITSVLSWLTR